MKQKIYILLFWIFLGFFSSNVLALVPDWKVYRDDYLDGDCPKIIKELGSIKVVVPGPYGEFWSKSMMLVGKCLLNEQQALKAKQFFKLSTQGVYPDAAIFHLTQANMEAGEKTEALENISHLLKQPKHGFYLERLRVLLRENYKSEEEQLILFQFLSKQRENPQALLHDAKLHEIFITQSEKLKQPVGKNLRLLGWIYPEDVETAKKTHQKIWPTDFQELNQNRIKTLQEQQIYER